MEHACNACLSLASSQWSPLCDLLALHRSYLLPCWPPAQVPDMVEAALREADTDHDGAVDLQDFKNFLASKTDDSLSLFDPRLSRDGADSGGSGSEGGAEGGGEGGGSRA